MNCECGHHREDHVPKHGCNERVGPDRKLCPCTKFVVQKHKSMSADCAEGFCDHDKDAE